MKRIFLFTLLISFLVNCFNSIAQVKDASNNLYKTGTIKNQEWILENLQTDKFRNGDLIKQAKQNRQPLLCQLGCSIVLIDSIPTAPAYHSTS